MSISLKKYLRVLGISLPANPGGKTHSLLDQHFLKLVELGKCPLKFSRRRKCAWFSGERGKGEMLTGTFLGGRETGSTPVEVSHIYMVWRLKVGIVRSPEHWTKIGAQAKQFVFPGKVTHQVR